MINASNISLECFWFETEPNSGATDFFLLPMGFTLIPILLLLLDCTNMK